MLLRVGNNKNSHTVLVGMQKWYSYFGRQFGMTVSQYSNELKTYDYKNLHMDVYSSFIITVKTKKSPRCPSVGEWYTQTMEYYSIVKRNELIIH